MEQNPAFLIYWNYNDSRAGLPTHEKICETQGTAASKVPFMFMPGFDSISCYTVGSSALLLCAATHGFRVALGALSWENRGNLHARSACLFAQCVVDCGLTYLQYAFALSPNLAQKCCAAQARRLPWFSQPRQEPEVPGPPACRSMRPCQLVRAPREHCAFLLCAAAHGFGVTLGALPL